MEMTLLLNSTYEPLRVVHWQKAIALLWQEKVEVLEFHVRGEQVDDAFALLTQPAPQVDGPLSRH